MKSWKEKKIEEIDLELEEAKQRLELDMKVIRERRNAAYEALRPRVRWLEKIASEPGRTKEFKEVINRIASFLSPTDKWFFYETWMGWKLRKA